MLSRSRVLILAKRSAGEFGRDHCSHLAAGIAYYALFALFPLLLFLAGITGLVLRDEDLQEDLIDAILDSVPLDEEQGRDNVTEIVQGMGQASSGAVGLLGLVLTAWSASTLFGAVRRSINIAYSVEQPRPIVRQKLVDLALLLAVGPFFLLSIALSTFVAFSRDAVGDVSGLSAIADQRLAWTVLGLGLSTCLSFAAFFVLYWMVPALDVQRRDACAGAVVAAILFEGAKSGFSLYLHNFGSYDVVFGTLGAAAGFLLWVYVSANILLLGAEIASEYSHVRAGEYDEPGKPPVPWRVRLREGLVGLVRRPPG